LSRTSRFPVSEVGDAGVDAVVDEGVDAVGDAGVDAVAPLVAASPATATADTSTARIAARRIGRG
jgi:hypothetical protein